LNLLIYVFILIIKFKFIKTLLNYIYIMSSPPDYELDEQFYENSDKSIKIFKVKLFINIFSQENQEQ